MGKRWFLVFIILFLVVIFIFLIVQNNQSPTVFPISPMKLNLDISNPPALGETAEITAILTYSSKIKENMPNVSISIILPKGLKLLEGNLIWEGEIKKNISYSILVKSIAVGNWTIEGNARTPPEGETYFGGRDFIYLTVTEDDAWFNKERFREIKECPKGENCTTSEPPN